MAESKALQKAHDSIATIYDKLDELAAYLDKIGWEGTANDLRAPFDLEMDRYQMDCGDLEVHGRGLRGRLYDYITSNSSPRPLEAASGHDTFVPASLIKMSEVTWYGVERSTVDRIIKFIETVRSDATPNPDVFKDKKEHQARLYEMVASSDDPARINEHVETLTGYKDDYKEVLDNFKATLQGHAANLEAELARGGRERKASFGRTKLDPWTDEEIRNKQQSIEIASSVADRVGEVLDVVKELNYIEPDQKVERPKRRGGVIGDILGDDFFDDVVDHGNGTVTRTTTSRSGGGSSSVSITTSSSSSSSSTSRVGRGRGTPPNPVNDPEGFERWMEEQVGGGRER